ncbi:MAG: hypothetical protein NUW01_01285 [Gemmatimonadaceae bacterium]|nr:hypothetical protein [Gemmatimonadaceae bacterium]
MKRDPHATLGATLDAQVDAKLTELQGELARVSKARQVEIDGLTQAIARLQAVKARLTPQVVALITDLHHAGLA